MSIRQPPVAADSQSVMCRFKDGERRVDDTERELGAKVQHGVQKAGNVAEHDYDR